MLTGVFRLASYFKYYESSKKVEGNLKGDGTLLGSVFVLGSNKEVLFEHREGKKLVEINVVPDFLATLGSERKPKMS